MGDSGEALAALNKMFYNPEGFKILPYKNTYGQDGQVQYTGYFIPSYTMWFGDDEGNVGFDERGVVDEEMAKRHFTKEFEKYEDPHALLISRAEYCFTPEDAFILEGSNRFDQELLVELYNNITIHKVIPGPQSAKLSWNISTETGGVDKLKRPKIEFITDGPLKIIEPPKLDQDGNVYSNLYVAGCLTPGEKVMTVDGLKNCEDVTLNDKLYSINGDPVDIINLQQYYKEDEDIFKVKLNNIFRTTTFTGEHPIYCATPNNHLYNFGFKLMKDVKIGDFVKVPNIYKLEKSIPLLYYPNFIKNKVNNPDFWWIIGHLLGKYNDNFKSYIHRLEDCYEEKVRRINKELFNEDEDSLFSSILLEIFGDNLNSIPEWIKFIPRELKINLITGYITTSGYKTDDGIYVETKSYKLLEDILDILFSIGIISTILLISENCERWKLSILGNKFTISDINLDNYNISNNSDCFFEDESCNYIYIRIDNIEHSKYTGIVYNYHCETSTFMCKYIPTHNCDAIDVDSTTSTGQTDVSKFCVIIYRRSFGIDPPKPVAIYIERPQHIQTAFDNALKLCSFYNAKMLVEATRISIKLYFEKEHMLHYLMKRPQSTANSSKKTNFRLYGVPATEAIIQHLLDLIELYIVDYSTEIQFPELLNELIKYSYENKRKFDMVAAFGIALLADEDMLGKVAMSTGIDKDNYINLSYYRNEYGLLEFGIPEKSDVRTENLRDDLWSLW